MTRNRPIIIVLTCAAIVLAFVALRPPAQARDDAERPVHTDVIKKLYEIEKRLSAIEERLAALHKLDSSNKPAFPS